MHTKLVFVIILVCLVAFIVACGDKGKQDPNEEKLVNEAPKFVCQDPVNGIKKCYSFLTTEEYQRINPKWTSVEKLGLYMEQTSTTTLVVFGSLQKDGALSSKYNPLVRLVVPVGNGTQVTTYQAARVGRSDDHGGCDITAIYSVKLGAGIAECGRGMMGPEQQFIIPQEDPVMELQEELYRLVWNDLLAARNINASNIFLHN